MWVSRRKWSAMEKRIAGIEKEVQSLQIREMLVHRTDDGVLVIEVKQNAEYIFNSLHSAIRDILQVSV